MYAEPGKGAIHGAKDLSGDVYLRLGLIATYKSGAYVAIWDLTMGAELARLKTTRRIPHGVAVSDDDKYAFVTLEGVGGEPGTVEVYDLTSKERVAVADVGKQAGGIIFWKGAQ